MSQWKSSSVGLKSFTGPLNDTNRRSALMNEELVISSTTSRWTALFVRYVNKMPYLLLCAASPLVRRFSTCHGKKASNPTAVNGYLSRRRSAIFLYWGTTSKLSTYEAIMNTRQYHLLCPDNPQTIWLYCSFIKKHTLMFHCLVMTLDQNNGYMIAFGKNYSVSLRDRQVSLNAANITTYTAKTIII